MSKNEILVFRESKKTNVDKRRLKARSCESKKTDMAKREILQSRESSKTDRNSWRLRERSRLASLFSTCGVFFPLGLLFCA